MSDFVNYNNRSVDLPSGCKDLADVLQSKVTVLQSQVTPVKCAKLSEIGSYVVRAWESKAKNVYLSLKPKLSVLADCALHFKIQRAPNTALQAKFEVQMGSAIMSSLKRFLQEHGYPFPNESVPKHFSPHLPVQVICEIFPLPNDPFQLAALVSSIFRQLCELADGANMTVHYVERE